MKFIWPPKDTVQILHTTKKGAYMNALEKYCIYKMCQQGNHLNDLFSDIKRIQYEASLVYQSTITPSRRKMTPHLYPLPNIAYQSSLLYRLHCHKNIHSITSILQSCYSEYDTIHSQ